MNEQEKFLEALLFTASELPLDEISKQLKLEKDSVLQLKNSLNNYYQKNNSALRMIEKGNKLSLQLLPEIESKFSFLSPLPKFSKSEMKTLLIIALKQPLKQAELIKYRSNRAYEEIKKLLEEGFILKKKYKNTFLLTTSKKFSDFFNVSTGELKNLIPKEHLEKFSEIQKELKIEEKKETLFSKLLGLFGFGK
jgi:segregation and condensation protein B